MITLRDKVSRIQSAATQEEAFKSFNRMMLEYGYTNNVYTFMNDHPSVGQNAYHGLATTYPPDWLAFYNAEKYQQVDAVWERLLKSPTPFFWADLVEQIKCDNQISDKRLKGSLLVMNEAEDAGVADGIGISYLSPLGEVAGMGLSRDRAEKSRSYQDLAEIFLLATFFHEKFLSFYDRANQPNITPREREVLLWAAESKSDEEIGGILNVAIPTIRFHWKNIFRKLGVHGRLLAVVTAMRLQIISPHLVRTPYQR